MMMIYFFYLCYFLTNLVACLILEVWKSKSKPFKSCNSTAIRYGRMPEAEKKKLVAGLLAGEKSLLNPGGSDLKTLAKHVNSAYQKNLNMTKKKARSILTGKTNCTPVILAFAKTLKKCQKSKSPLSQEQHCLISQSNIPV